MDNGSLLPPCLMTQSWPKQSKGNSCESSMGAASKAHSVPSMTNTNTQFRYFGTTSWQNSPNLKALRVAKEDRLVQFHKKEQWKPCSRTEGLRDKNSDSKQQCLEASCHLTYWIIIKKHGPNIRNYSKALLWQDLRLWNLVSSQRKC